MEETVRESLGPFGLRRVVVRAREDNDGDPVTLSRRTRRPTRGSSSSAPLSSDLGGHSRQMNVLPPCLSPEPRDPLGSPGAYWHVLPLANTYNEWDARK